MRKNQRLAIAAICCVVFTLVRVFFTAVFFITSVICIMIAESRVERCDGHVILSQIAVDSLNTTSTFVETDFVLSDLSNLLVEAVQLQKFPLSSPKTGRLLDVDNFMDCSYFHERSHRHNSGN